MARIEGEAEELVGEELNLSSPQQVAAALYGTLKVAAGLLWLVCHVAAVLLHAVATSTHAAPAPLPLQLPPPTARGRAAAKTHLPTDEAALRELQALSPLPGLVLAHREVGLAGKSVGGRWGRQSRRQGRCLVL